jgi:hypothetical protein
MHFYFSTPVVSLLMVVAAPVDDMKLGRGLQVAEAEKVFAVLQRLDGKAGTRCMMAYRFYAHMLQCMGKHAAAIRVLTDALAPLNGKIPSEQKIECLYLRGVSFSGNLLTLNQASDPTVAAARRLKLRRILRCTAANLLLRFHL